MRLRNVKPEVSYGFQPGAEPASMPANVAMRIGIYSGGFDPVHAGHLIFALKAQKIANLERICFVPERRPKRNNEAEHYVHRATMLKHALRPYSQFSLFDLPDAHLTARSLPRLRQQFPAAEFSLLTTASELLWHRGDLPKLFHKLHLIIAVTSHAQMAEVLTRLNAIDEPFYNLMFVDISSDHISSAAVRSGLRSGRPVRGLLPSVWRYARNQWLYIVPLKDN